MAKSFRRGGRTIRRDTLWLGGTFVNTTLTSASSAALVTSLSAGALALRPFTIVRTRGIIQVQSDQEAASEDYSGVVARLVVSDQANAAGIGSVPTPVTESDSDLFMLYEPFASAMLDTGTSQQDGIGVQRVIDSKAMRKVDVGQDLIQVIENSSVSNGCVWTTMFRTLIKLH